jgi:C4-dicarboxylate-specific signal transduction histidine kinase
MSIDFRAYPILYVDDETANLVTVRYLLDGSFELLTAQSGEEALRILAEREDIAVVLCDQRMPGMSGVEVCERAREIRPDAVRIIITAYSDLHAAVDAINRGQVVRYIQKPFRNEELIGVLQTAVYLVHVQRAVQDLEVRLLQAGQSTTARTIEVSIGHEFGNVLLGLETNLSHAAELTRGASKQWESNAAHARKMLEEATNAFADAQLSVTRLKDMVGRLKSSQRVRPRERCYLDRVVDSTVRILRNEIEKVARVQVVSEGSPCVEMEASVLGQVVTNLLLNAAQAMEERPRDEARIVVSVAPIGERALLSVADNGPGIPTEHLERVFDAHFTTKEGGNGLGLAIVHEMVTEANGLVNVDTGPDGTTFVVDLPLVTPGSAPPHRMG